MRNTPQPIDEVDETDNMTHKQRHVTRHTPPYHRDLVLIICLQRVRVPLRD
jgi:hypothetical protein